MLVKVGAVLKPMAGVENSEVFPLASVAVATMRSVKTTEAAGTNVAVAAACGVDVTRIAYEDLIGERPDSAKMNGRRRRWAITLLAGERPAPQRPPYVDAVFARDDVKPVLAQLRRLLG